MCRGLWLLQNLDNVTIDELLVFIKRRIRIYGIFFVLQAVTLGLQSDFHTSYVAFSITTLVLYVISIFALLRLSNDPTSNNALYPIIASVLVFIFNIFDLTYTMIESTNYYALIAIISILLQVATFILLLRLRTMLMEREQGKGDEALEQPVENIWPQNDFNCENPYSNRNSTGNNASASDIENPVITGTHVVR